MGWGSINQVVTKEHDALQVHIHLIVGVSEHLVDISIPGCTGLQVSHYMGGAHLFWIA